MASPFPGMNPYLERPSVWTNFHDSFVPALRDALIGQVVPKYFVDIQEHLYLHEWANPFARSDVSVEDRSGPASTTLSGPATLTAPVVLKDAIPTVDFERIPYLEIVSREDKRIVTVIELLSPTNKYSGPDRAAFIKKRWEYLRRAAHYVVIDLLRGGPRMPITKLPDCDYYVYLSRFDQRPDVEFWPIGLREPLPTIPIPLLPGDRDVQVNLQAVLNDVYDRARYEFVIYQGSPEPALSPEDAEWARQFVPAHS
jgi:hypothetical protein